MFTKEEFQTMVKELLYTKPTSYDMLCKIAQTSIEPLMNYWCNTSSVLRGRQYEGDILGDIYIRLMKNTVTGFLLPDGVDGKVNMDPEGFNKWMFTVAVNVKRSWERKIGREDGKHSEIDDNITVPGPDETADGEECIQKLQAAFNRILDSGLSIYKVLSWVAQFVFILEKDITKIQSNDAIIAAFEEKTLGEMYEIIRSSAKKISWLRISDEQDRKIKAALNKAWDENRSYGEVQYKEFFMKKGGKKSLSDWTNRLNDKLRKEYEDEDDESSDNR